MGREHVRVCASVCMYVVHTPRWVGLDREDRKGRMLLYILLSLIYGVTLANFITFFGFPRP